MTDRVNFADCYVLTPKRTSPFLISFLDHFLRQREAYATQFEVPQQADPPEHIFNTAEELIAYLVSHPTEVHAIYWQNNEPSPIRAGMLLFTSDGQVIAGLTCETHYPDRSMERHYLMQLEAFCDSTIGLIEYDTPAAKDTGTFLQRIAQQNKQLIEKAYDAFNKRDLETALELMTTDVQWPNGWEGGYVYGQEEVKNYWTRQWKEIDPSVYPLCIVEDANGKMRVTVKQIVKDKQGQLLYEGQVAHIYSLDHGLIQHMEIEK
jgi:nuclear transport factor 2 (NTF2) superfamily protein